MTISLPRGGAVMVLAVMIAAVPAPVAHAQEPINSPAATQPSTGRWVLRNQVRYLEARSDPESGAERFQELTLWNNIAYGIRRDLSANLTVPVKFRNHRDADGRRIKNEAIGDITAQLKWRVFQDDFGPIDTSRFSLIGGVEIPTFDSDMSTESVNPIIGGVFTHVQGRHGFNASGRYKFNTGTGAPINLGGGSGKADALFYDASYLYRLYPTEYGPGSEGALYGVIELNGIYETNGDNEISLTPGIMWEARTWTLETAIRLPVWQDLDRRPETRFELIAGLRLLF